MATLALRASNVSRHPLVAGGGEMEETSRELAILRRTRELRGALERPDGVKPLTLAQVRVTDVEGALEEIRAGQVRPLAPRSAHADSQENPIGRTGGASGLPGRPERGVGSLYAPGATSFGPSA